MATGLMMPTLPADQQQSRHMLLNNMYTHASVLEHAHNTHNTHQPYHTRSHSYQVPVGPQISPLDTSASGTPQTPAYSPPPSPLSRHFLQNGGRPMYMPAVLRRCDEFPSHKVTRCRTAGSTSSSESDSTLKRANTVLMSIPGLSMLGQHLARRSASEGNRTLCLDGDWELDSFPPVTGMPTRNHWKPDSESSICDDATCKRTFNYFVRRHHCRKCGNIFCDWHSSATLPLDHNADFNPRAAPSRTCNHCFDQTKAQAHHSRTNSQSSGSTLDVATTPPTPVSATPIPGVTPPHKPEPAASVPRNWNWSTF
ncbi:hypothetical protein E4U41_006785 [Claviceps citrina]|nr:hypothetical protein E4U41_006785 [Claviceps citrina]